MGLLIRVVLLMGLGLGSAYRTSHCPCMLSSPFSGTIRPASMQVKTSGRKLWSRRRLAFILMKTEFYWFSCLPENTWNHKEAKKMPGICPNPVH